MKTWWWHWRCGLKVVGGRITEVEQLAIRPEGVLTSNGQRPTTRPTSTGERVEKLGAPNAVFREAIPGVEARLARRAHQDGELLLLGLQANDGKGYYPFTDDCDRLRERQPRHQRASTQPR